MITLRLVTGIEIKDFLSSHQDNLEKNGLITFNTLLDDLLDYGNKLSSADKEVYLHTTFGSYPIIGSVAANSMYYHSSVTKVFQSLEEAQSYIQNNNILFLRYYIRPDKKIYEWNNKNDEQSNKEDIGLIGSFCFIADYSTNTQKYLLYFNSCWNEFNKDTDISDHVNDFNNPHKVTKEQIGLGNVLNVAQASQKEFRDHVNDFNNPHNTTKENIGLGNVINEKQTDKIIFDIHVKNNFNPHQITKIDIGLGNVEDFPQLPAKDLLDHISHHLVHQETKETIELGNVPNILQATKEDFEYHLSKSNAHNITKEQVGLGNVPNILQATNKEFIQHINNQNNPHGVTKEDIGLGNLSDKEQGSPEIFDAHVNNTNNPHKVTKESIGLGNVENIKQLSKEIFDAHVNNTNNPHKVTKESIGLGNVRNILSVSKEIFDAHVNNHNNPHKVTLEQLGLSNLDPSKPLFPIAEWQEHVTNVYNPHKVTKEQIGLENVRNINHLSKADFDAHNNNYNNPHKITKENIGLGNVDNTADVDKPLSDAFLSEISQKLYHTFILIGETSVPLLTSDNKIDKRYLDEFMGNYLGIIENGNFTASTNPSLIGNPLPTDDRYLSMFVICNSNGSINSVNYKIGDILIYNKNPKKWVLWNNNIEFNYNGNNYTYTELSPNINTCATIGEIIPFVQKLMIIPEFIAINNAPLYIKNTIKANTIVSISVYGKNLTLE